MSKWKAYDSITERNADTEARVKGQEIYIAETKPGSGVAVRQYWDNSWIKLGEDIPAVSAPADGPPPEPIPPKPENEKDLYKNPWNKYSAYHRPMGSGAVPKISPSTLKPNDKSPVYANGGAVLTKTSPNPLANIGRLTCKSGKQGVKYWYRGEGPNKSTRITDTNANVVEPTPTGVPLPADQGDSNFLLLRSDNVTCSLYFNYYSGKGTAKSHRTYKIDALDTDNDGQPGGSSASRVRWPMALDANELKSGTIGHCLNVTATRHNNNGATDKAHILGKGMVWPAYARDGTADQVSNNKGVVPYGQKLGLPDFFDVEVAALKLNDTGKTLAKNLKQFGWYVLDGSGQTAGSPDKGVLQIRVNQTIMPDDQLADEIDAQLAMLLPYIRPMGDPRPHDRETEDGPLGPCTGGGTPLAPNTAHDA